MPEDKLGKENLWEIDKPYNLAKRDQIATKDRPIQIWYGFNDKNLNGKIDDDEKKRVYFEFSDYSTSYIFYEDKDK